MYPLGIDYGTLSGYGSLALTEASPPQSFTEPLTLEAMQSYLKVPDRAVQDTEEIALIVELITSAREIAEVIQGRDLIRKQWDLSLDYWPMNAVELRSPLVSVDAVMFRDSDGNYTTLAEDADFAIDKIKTPGILLPLYNQTLPSFTPWPSSAITIRFTSGYASDSIFWQDAGARIKNGMRLLISAWFNQRIPYDVSVEEIPYSITACLRYGAVERAR